jgi:hypothetical protein
MGENEDLKNEFVQEGDYGSNALKKCSKSEIEQSGAEGVTQSKLVEDEKESHLISRLTTNSEGGVAKIILQSIPSESEVTLTRFEGPNIALYTKNPKFSLTELTYHLSALSKTLKKRFVIRTDPSIRLPEDKTRSVVVKLLPRDVSVSAVFCDDATGEVILEVNHPEIIDSNMVIEIAQTTGWIAHTRRSPHIPSNSISTIHSTLKNSAKERTVFLRELGNRIFRNPLILNNNGINGSSDENRHSKQERQQRIITTEPSTRPPPQQPWPISKEEVMLFCLGGVKQVGRSCFIVVTPESKVMLDCGINPGEALGLNAYPRLEWFNFNLDDLDAVIISHAHIDHQGFLPALFKY